MLCCHLCYIVARRGLTLGGPHDGKREVPQRAPRGGRGSKKVGWLPCCSTSVTCHCSQLQAGRVRGQGILLWTLLLNPSGQAGLLQHAQAEISGLSSIRASSLSLSFCLHPTHSILGAGCIQSFVFAEIGKKAMQSFAPDEAAASAPVDHEDDDDTEDVDAGNLDPKVRHMARFWNVHKLPSGDFHCQPRNLYYRFSVRILSW